MEHRLKSYVLVDSNVWLDLRSADSIWGAWSSAWVISTGLQFRPALNPIILAELAPGFDSMQALDEAYPASDIARLPLPWDAAFDAGRAFARYRRLGGARSAPLGDFYIGAHAMVERLTLLTRDATLYRTYFPDLDIIAPDTHPEAPR